MDGCDDEAMPESMLLPLKEMESRKQGREEGGRKRTGCVIESIASSLASTIEDAKQWLYTRVQGYILR